MANKPRYLPRHSYSAPEPDATRIAREIAPSCSGEPIDIVAAKLRRRLTDAGVKPVGAEFMALANAIADGSIDHAQ